MLADVARAHSVSGVVATDDATVEVACAVGRELGWRHNPPESVQLSRRKDLARRALRLHGAPTPEFRVVDVTRNLLRQLEQVRFPCVVKPVALSGSRGVIRCDGPAQLEGTVRRVARIAAHSAAPAERTKVLIEQFLPGREVAVEAMLVGGKLNVLAVFDKPEPLDGPYFEETYYVTPSRLEPDMLNAVAHRAQEAVRAYGLVEGPVHAELRVVDGDATVIEVAARTIGGDCARMLRFGSGRTLEQLVLLHAIGGLDAPLRAVEEAVGVLMLPTPSAGTLRRVEGVLDARQVPGVEEVVIAVREGYELVPLPEGSSYLGFVFARGPTPAAVERALRDAHAKLRIVTAPRWRIETG